MDSSRELDDLPTLVAIGLLAYPPLTSPIMSWGMAACAW